MSRKIKHYSLIVFWMFVIFLLSSIQGNDRAGEADFWFYASRKGAHVFEYAVLTFLFLRAFEIHKMTKREKTMSAIVLPLAYAVTDEVHQLFVPGRTGKLMDVGIDLVGIVLVIVVWNVWMKRRMKKRET